MGTQKLFVPAGLKVGTTYLAHAGERTIDNALEALTMSAAGDWAPNFTGTKLWSPEFQVETQDLAKALDLMTTNRICRDCSAETVKIMERAIQQSAMQYAEASAEHEVYQLVSDAMLYWTQIRAQQGDECSISVVACARYNGLNAPLAQLSGESIDTAGAALAPYTLGPLLINTVQFEGLKSFTFALNPQVEKEASDGEDAPSFLCIRGVRPVLQGECSDLSALQALPKGVAVTSWTQYFTRRQSSLLNRPWTDAVHAKLYNTGDSCGTLRWNRVSGAPSRVQVELHLHRPAGGSLFQYAKDVQIVV